MRLASTIGCGWFGVNFHSRFRFTKIELKATSCGAEGRWGEELGLGVARAGELLRRRSWKRNEGVHRTK